MTAPSLDLFLQACQAAGPLELQVSRAGQSDPRPFTAGLPFALVGRDPSNDLALDDPLVSQRHVYVQLIGGRAFCVDLGSRTGIRCDGRPGSSGWLDAGQVLSIGPYSLRFTGPTPAGPAPAGNPLETRSAEQHLLPGAVLEFVNGMTRQSRWRLSRVLTLTGRAPGCKLQLADNSVSRFHCALLGTPEGVWVIDLLGRDGTWVNGQRVRWARLEDGDRLQVGRFVVRLLYEPAGASPARLATPPPVLLQPTADRGSNPFVVADPDAAPPTPPAEPEESVLAPVARQLHELHDQAQDQFHQSMLLVMQTVAALGTAGPGPWRDELERVQRLTEELHALQSGQTGNGAAPDPGALAQRVAALHRERQDRWRKVLELVLKETPAPA